MWPWEHAMVGYVLYSGYARFSGRRRPSDRAAIVVVVAAVLPDLIDKPLAWQLELLPTGRSLGHSLLFALPLIALVLLATRRYGAGDVGPAFSIGYLSHLPADSIYPLVVPGVALDLGYLLWPFASAGSTQTGDLYGHVLFLLRDFAHLLAGPDGWRYLLVEASLLTLAVGLWIVDGLPGLGTIRRRIDSRGKT